MRVIIYTRVSTGKQNAGLEMQKEKLIEFCTRKGLVVTEFLEEEAVSGGMYLFKRPQGSKLKDLKRGDTLIVYRADRLFRSFRNAINVTCDLVEAGVKLYITSFHEEPISFENYQNETSLYFSYVMAHHEKRQIGQRTKDVMQSKKAQGKPYSRANFGTKNVFTLNESNRRIGVTIETNEQEAQILQYAYDLRQEVLSNRRQRSYAKVAKILNEKGMYTQTGKAWNHGNLPVAFENGIKNGVIKVKCTQ
jgi:DNA invertase Pin-like site-specific DNA recombinase